MTEPDKTKAGGTDSVANVEHPSRIGAVRFSAGQFLISLLLLFAVSPFVTELEYGDTIEAILLTVVLLSGALAVGWRHRTLVIAGLLVLPAVAGKWLNHYRPDIVPHEVALVFGAVFVLFVGVKLLVFVLRAPRVNSEVLCAGVSNYLLMGLLWSLGYQLISQADPASFALNAVAMSGEGLSRLEAFYFSFATLTTVGYGDITPVSEYARMMSVMEAVVGTLYVTVFIARLVALYTSQGLEKNDGAKS